MVITYVEAMRQAAACANTAAKGFSNSEPSARAALAWVAIAREIREAARQNTPDVPAYDPQPR